MAHDPAARAAVSEREALRQEQAELVKDEMFRIAIKGQREADRVTAGATFLNRVEGMALQKTHNIINDITGMTREQIEAEIARIEHLTGRAQAARPVSRVASPGLPGKSADVVPDGA